VAITDSANFPGHVAILLAQGRQSVVQQRGAVQQKKPQKGTKHTKDFLNFPLCSFVPLVVEAFALGRSYCTVMVLAVL
jgi:hypothetical protein